MCRISTKFASYLPGGIVPDAVDTALYRAKQEGRDRGVVAEKAYTTPYLWDIKKYKMLGL